MTSSCQFMRKRASKPLSRRNFIATLEAATLLAGCGEIDRQAPVVALRSGPQLAVSVQKAKPYQDALLDDPSRCSLSADLAWLVQPGDQIRVLRNADEYALYTVDALTDDPPATVRMSQEGRSRLGTSQSFAGVLDPQVPALDLDDAEAEAQSEFVERRGGNDNQTALLAIAPHGGSIEAHTDEQAVALAAACGGASWVCKGWRSGGGAYDRWHITSTAISPASFPELAVLAGVGFARVVSFHGMSAAGVRVGGAAPLPLRQLVADAITEALSGTGLSAAAAQPGDSLSGSSPANLVNWLTASGSDGIQIEQNSDVRSDHAAAVVAAVAAVLAGP